MWNTIFEKTSELVAARQPFAVATVISVQGSTSAKPASKALFSSEGINLFGWVGGGCAERYVASQAIKAMESGETRIVHVDLDDEVFGLGLPCGGTMEVYIEPVLPSPIIALYDIPESRKELITQLVDSLNFDLTFAASSESNIQQELALKGLSPAERAVLDVVSGIQRQRGLHFESLSHAVRTCCDNEDFKIQSALAGEPQLVVLGHSRITEEIAKLATFLSWTTRVLAKGANKDNYHRDIDILDLGAGYSNVRFAPNSLVVVASHHRGDEEFIRRALESRAFYVSLVASQKRSRLVLERLRTSEIDASKLERVCAPAGLNLHCNTPAEIAMSIVAEIILKIRGLSMTSDTAVGVLQSESINGSVTT